MTYSVQQIKFEFISYVKEFGGNFTDWHIGVALDAPKALFQVHKVDPVHDFWLWKPALTSAAARLVTTWMTQRQNAHPAAGDTEGDCVFMFKKAEIVGAGAAPGSTPSP